MNSGYKRPTITYSYPIIFDNNNKRSRIFICFTRHFNLMAKTKLGQILLNVINKHLPSTNPLSKIFDKKYTHVS